ncbi:RPS15 [Ecytonucleospora hepatopenaei]|uniref:RPS15 n=1 Tax=Ecytonucleospora hepatopenaei TaxID=646526 RepID=A0A1W0E4S2_9MICR|nr:RPS15 [Ecytonucleospora hepatopenaei]
MAEQKKSRNFKTFMYRGKDLDTLMSMKMSEFAQLVPSKCKRHLLRGINKYENDLLQKVEEWHEKHKQTGEKPGPIKTHERTMVIMPSMIGCSIAVHCGNGFFPLDIKAEMIGKKLKDYVSTKVHPSHGRPGVGAIQSGKFVPLK